MATYQDAINAGYAKSSKNQPGVLTTAAEDFAQMQRVMQGVFSFAAAINPTALATTLGVVGGVGTASGQWLRPEDAEAITAVRNAAGVDVSVVPHTDPLAVDPKPAIYEFGGVFITSPGQVNPPGPTSTLTFWYAKRPDVPADVNTDIDAVFPDAYLDLPAYQYAIYLARKDGRMEDVAMATQDRDTWAQRFASWLNRGTPIVQSRFGQRNIHDVESLIPLLGG